MTYQSENPSSSIIGNSATTTFSVPFHVRETDDLFVFVNSEVQTLNIDYTVSANVDGLIDKVIFLSAPTDQSRIRIFRTTVPNQQINFTVPAQVRDWNTESKNIYKILDEHRNLIDNRVIRLMDHSTVDASSVTMYIPDPEARKFLVWNSAATQWVYSDLTMDEIFDVFEDASNAVSAAQMWAIISQNAASNAQSTLQQVSAAVSAAVDTVSATGQFWIDAFGISAGAAKFFGDISASGWVSDSGRYLYEFKRITHFQDQRPFVQVHDNTGDIVYLDDIIVVSSNSVSAGDVKLYVPQNPDLRFEGKIIISRADRSLAAVDYIADSASARSVTCAPIDGSVRVATDGTVRLTITSAGNIGIGTVNPEELLTVEGSNATIRLKDSATPSQSFMAITHGTDLGTINVNASGQSFLNINVKDTVRINRDVETSAIAGLQIFKGNNTATINHSLSNGISYLVADNGNLGIGTASPSTKLHVKGTVRVSADGSFYNLPISAGTNGQVLTTGGSNSNATWTDQATGVIQRVSNNLTVPTGGGFREFNYLTAGLGGEPHIIIPEIVCTTASNGYAVNDIIVLENAEFDFTSGATRQTFSSSRRPSTGIARVSFNANVYAAHRNGNSFFLVGSNFRLRIRCIRFA